MCARGALRAVMLRGGAARTQDALHVVCQRPALLQRSLKAHESHRQGMRAGLLVAGPVPGRKGGAEDVQALPLRVQGLQAKHPVGDHRRSLRQRRLRRHPRRRALRPHPDGVIQALRCSQVGCLRRVNSHAQALGVHTRLARRQTGGADACHGLIPDGAQPGPELLLPVLQLPLECGRVLLGLS